MSHTFKMRVREIFHIGEKTIIAGELQSTVKLIKAAPCRIIVDGVEAETIQIDGEVCVSGRHRDLWTKSVISLDPETVRTHDVWIVGAGP